MAQDGGDETRELKRLLRQIEAADQPEQPRRLPGARRLDTADAPEPARPAVDTGGPAGHLRTQPGTTQARDGRVALGALASAPPRKLGLAGKTAIAAVFVAVLAVVLTRTMPPISIVVIRGSVDPSGLQGIDLAPRTVVDPDPTPQRSTANSAADPEQEKPQRPAPSIAYQKVFARRDQIVSLPVHTSAGVDDATWSVKGLVGGARLSAGRLLDAGTWELSAGEAESAVIIPPSGFVGTMDLTVELRGRDATVQQAVQVEWLEEPAATVQQPPPARLSPAEVGRLVKRGQELLGSGDVAAARAVFRLLANSREPQGAFMLAETYEQSTLARLGTKGLDPDSEMARTWYQKAHELGSTEARHRLDVLASKQK
jgi:hypothetical protein